MKAKASIKSKMNLTAPEKPANVPGMRSQTARTAAAAPNMTGTPMNPQAMTAPNAKFSKGKPGIKSARKP